MRGGRAGGMLRRGEDRGAVSENAVRRRRWILPLFTFTLPDWTHYVTKLRPVVARDVDGGWCMIRRAHEGACGGYVGLASKPMLQGR